MKYGYSCSCGWHLNRADLTRREYAIKKELHAETCRDAANETRRSRKLPLLTEESEQPYSVGTH
jgi:hypothetical protein